MKLGKPKRYTLFRNAKDIVSSQNCNKSHSVIIMANSNSHPSLVASMSSWLLVPKGRNFRHILATVLCVILVYHVTLLAIPTNNLPSSSSIGAVVGGNSEINSVPSAAFLTICESCENDVLRDVTSGNQISQPQNSPDKHSNKNEDEDRSLPIVGTNEKTESQEASGNNLAITAASPHPHHPPIQPRSSDDHDTKKSPPETSASNFNYYYTDELSNGNRDNRNYDVNIQMAGENDDESSNDNQSENERDSISATAKTASYANHPSQSKATDEVNQSTKLQSNNLETISNSVPVKKHPANKKVSKKLMNLQYHQRRKLLDSIFLSIKSTKKFHKTRLEPVINTWFNLAKDQTWIFTDDDDPELNRRTNGHIINTHCSSTHYRQALCCKMSAEFDTFMKSQKSWFCHFDDDNYVNVPALLDLLSKYDHKEDWYLGKPSLKSPIKIPHPDNKSEEISFWFATGGAGFCLSRALAKRMSPVASGGKFTNLCDSIQLPDDVTMGYIAGHLLGRNLTVIPQFHSHFETMRFLDMKNPHPEITFSYVRYADNSLNTLEIDGFTEEEDPTRFLSLHCLLFPNFSFCQKSKR